MRSAGRCWVLLLWLAAAISPAVASPPGTERPIELAVLQADQALDFERIREPDRQAEFASLPGTGVDVLTPAGQLLWLRIRTSLPAVPEPADQQHWVLMLDRVSIERLQVYLPRPELGGFTLHEDGFFAPQPATMRSHFAVRLPHLSAGPVEIWVAIKSRISTRTVLKLVDEQAFQDEDRRAGHLASAAYAGILVIALSSLALFVALRERYFLSFAGFSAASLLLLLALSGHFYALPGGGLLARAGVGGLLAVALLAAASALDFTRRFLALGEHEPGLSRGVQLLGYLMLLAALLALLLPAAPLAAQYVAFGLLSLSLAALLGVSARRWRRGARWGLPTTVLWLVFSWALGGRMAMSLQLIDPGFWSMHGYQPVLAVGLFLFSMALAGRVMEFRQQHERVHLLHAKSDADLQVEQRRRQFTEALQDALRNAVAAGDLEWRAFKQLSQTVGSLLPNRAIAVTATGYRGFDFLLAEPMSAKTRYCHLLAARSATLKGICRSRSPVQLKLDLAAGDGTDGPEGRPAEHAQFAIVPMQIARPGWGALLIERGPDESFDPQELAMAAEFVALTLAAAEEGALKAELRRTAEVDPLTGVLNRRAGDERLEQIFRRSLSEREPLAVLFADLDHFKQVNDRHGHAAGDECLRALANAIRPHLGGDDLLIRYGGEEFLVALPQRGIDEARAIGERIRSQVAMLRVEAEDALVKLTVSIGVAVRLPNDDRAQPLIERADRALYAAKRNGRNQVQVASAYGGQGEAKELPPLY